MAKRNKKKTKPTAMFNCLTRIKSTTASIKSSMTAAYGVYEDFCKETTLHGLRHTVEEKLHWFERFLWFVLTICAFAGAVFCALSQYNRYNLEPVVVSLQRDYRSWWTTFPAVTACFTERVQPEKARDAIETLWNITEDSDPERYQYYMEFIDLIADVSFRDNLQNFWKYQADETVAGIDLLQLALSVHPDFQFDVMIPQNEKNVVWHPIMTEVGMCLTFNSVYAQYQYMLEEVDWRPTRQLKCHYHSGQCYVRIDSSNAVRYFIHSPFEISTAISNPTGEVSPGEELIIDFKAVEIQASPSIKNLRPEQRRCRYPDEWIHKEIKAYSFALCQMHCRSRMAVMFCGCRPYFHVKGDGSVCDAHGMACIGRNVEILINIPKNLAKCSCLPQCAELNYYSHTKKVVIRSADLEEDTVAAIRINLMPPKYRLHRDVIFTLEDLFELTIHAALRFYKCFFTRSSLGGTTALFVGASVLTVVETVFFIIRNFVKLLLNANCLGNTQVVGGH